MPEPRRSFADLYARSEADARAEWEASGSALPFTEWRLQETERRRAEDDARHKAEMQAEAHARRVAALLWQIPDRYRHATTDHPELHQWTEKMLAWSQQQRALAKRRAQLVDEPWRAPLELDNEPVLAGPSLLLLGPTGVGKTHAAYGALRRYVDAGGTASVVIETAADLYAALRPRPGVDSEDVFNGYAKAPVLFIDDLGAAKSSEWVEEINYRLINYRWNHQLATLITSNVPIRELGGYLGDRVASRLTGMCSTVVLKGQDRRKAA
jgi:DNA replication protein DnaC